MEENGIGIRPFSSRVASLCCRMFGKTIQSNQNVKKMAAWELTDYNATAEFQPFGSLKPPPMPGIVQKVIGTFVESRPNEVQGTPVEPVVAGATGENGATQHGYGVLGHRRKHRHRSRSKRKKLKLLLRQVLVVASSVAVVVMALLWWRYLVN